jgi:hypothetical protein
LWHQFIISQCADTAQRRISLLGRMTPISGRGDLQHFADRLDTIDIAVLVDKRP